MSKALFLAKLLPELLATGRALYDLFGGDLDRSRSALSILRDHGARLDLERIAIDQELAERRAAAKGSS